MPTNNPQRTYDPQDITEEQMETVQNAMSNVPLLSTTQPRNTAEWLVLPSSVYGMDMSWGQSGPTPQGIPNLAKGATRHTLYGGSVILDFNPKSSQYRYTVYDLRSKRIGEPVRGVTSVLKDIVAKPELMRWPMNMSNGAIFGAKFSEKDLEYVHDWDNALVKPGTPYTAEHLHETMLAGSRAHTQRSDRGKDIGSMAHRAVEWFLKDIQHKNKENKFIKDILKEEFNISEENWKIVENMLDTFVRWWNDIGFTEVFATEAVVYSRKLNYAGTLDMILVRKGKIYLLDLKTTNYSKKAPKGIYAENFLQLGAYAYAFREEQGVQMNDLGIVNINKEGKLNVLTAGDLGFTTDDCAKGFAFALRTHDWLSQADAKLKENAPGKALQPSTSKVDAKVDIAK